MQQNYYAGVGSRKTPLYIMYMMSQLAVIFEKKGFILRSGCALGADAAFEDALLNPSETAEIYIPRKNFPAKMGTKLKPHYIHPEVDYAEGGINSLFRKATRLIHQKDIHKLWKFCPPDIMIMHNRNMFQVLGRDLKTKSNFTICYTRGKETKYEDTTKKTGGTGTAINASDLHNIDVFNLSVDEHYNRLQNFIADNNHLIDYNKLNKVVPRSDFNEKVNNLFVYNYNELMDTILKQKEDRAIKIIENKERKKNEANKPIEKKSQRKKVKLNRVS